MATTRSSGTVGTPSSPDAGPEASKTLIICLGLSQLIGWGALHYIIGVFGVDMATSLEWSDVVVQGGFSASLVVMGLSSRLIGQWIDRYGGRTAMMAGCWIGALGCVLLSASQNVVTYYAAWCVLGVAMRLALYDAAFATLVKVAGGKSQRAMTAITLFGGLASTTFWPLGHALAQMYGWRGALLVYALILVGASFLHLAIPKVPQEPLNGASHAGSTASVVVVPNVLSKTILYGLSAMMVLFMQAGMASHFIEILSALGWPIAAVVTVSTLFGIGQVTGRLYMVFHGYRFNPVKMNLLPPCLLICSYLMFFAGKQSLYFAGAFALLYGAGNGIATITRGAVPIVLFGTQGYGRRVGSILRPAFVVSAAAPMAFAWVMGGWGAFVTVGTSLVFSAVLLGVALALVYLSSRK